MAIKHHALSLLLLTTLVALGLCQTQYVDDNQTPAVQSVQPCYLYGDSDLYGLGVRISFYIEFSMGALGHLLDLRAEIKSLRQSFNILFLAILIMLYRNVHAGSFALLEWYITSLLLLCLPFVLLPRPLEKFIESRYEYKGSNDPETPPPRNPQRGIFAKTLYWFIPEYLRGGGQNGLNISDYWLRDPIGIGLLFILYGIYCAFQPWLYFTATYHGHKPGCLARVYVPYMTINLYGKHWLRFLKVSSIIMVFIALFVLTAGLYSIYQGVKNRDIINEQVQRINNREKKRWEAIERYLRSKGETPAGSSGETTDSPENDQDVRETLGKEMQLDGGAGEPSVGEITEIQKQTQLFLLARLGFLVFDVLIGASAALLVEKTLRANDIAVDNDIANRTGQMLPLLLSILTAVSFLWTAYGSCLEQIQRGKNIRMYAKIKGREQAEEQGLLWRAFAWSPRAESQPPNMREREGAV